MPQFATSTTAATPIPANNLRVSLLLLNIDATNNIFLDTSTRVGTVSSTNAGVRLTPNQSVAVNKLTDGLAQIQDSWQAIASAGTPTLLWLETERLDRRTGKLEFLDTELLEKVIQILQQSQQVKK